MSNLIFVGLMFLLILIGVPITFSLSAAALVFFFAKDLPLNTYVQMMATSVDSFALLALPFFILAGNLMNKGGITQRLFNCINNFLGNVRGGMCYVVILTSTIFSAMSGSALTNAAGLGTLQIQALKEQGYSTKFSSCLVSSGSILGPIIPPSVIMIIFGVTAGVSISKMFIGGVMPGLLFSGALIVLCALLGKKQNFPRGEKFSLKKSLRGLKDAFWALLVPVIILGGIFTGVFTATESGAIAAIYATIVSIFVYRTMTFKDLLNALYETGKTTGTILMITATGTLFGFCLTFARVPAILAESIMSVVNSKYVLLLILMAVYLFLGCIMDGGAAVITTVPIFVPICNAFGIDLVYFGVFVGIIMSIGTMTPPVGTAMFVICRNTGLTITEYAKAMIPYYALMAAFVTLLIIVPQIILWLPSLI